MTDPRVRAALLRVLVDCSTRRQIPSTQLERGVSDDSPRVRLEAVRGLARLPIIVSTGADGALYTEFALRALDKPMDRNPDTVKLLRTTTRVKTVSKADQDALIDKLKNDLDSMSEMGEMESLRLQMAMDRMSKMMSTISNLLKKISKTTDDIIQNLK